MIQCNKEAKEARIQSQNQSKTLNIKHYGKYAVVNTQYKA